MKKNQKLLSKYEKWDVVGKSQITNHPIRKTSSSNEASKFQKEDLTKTLLLNRGIKTKKQREDYFTPTHPEKIKLADMGMDKKSVQKAIERLKSALKNKEKVIIFGDYDVDGICSSAIIWEYLYGLGLDVTPYIPERFSEGYGIKAESIDKLKKENPDLTLIITVDNGIVAFDAVKKAEKEGIDILIIDHHEKGERYPDAHSIIHTTKLCGSAISWVMVREIGQVIDKSHDVRNSLELAALGTVADQMPLIGVNRSFVKYGLEDLNNTKRLGLSVLYESAGIQKGNVGVYEINYVIAPRLNAMGRLENAIESLRLLCTKSKKRAYELSELLNKTNSKRQKIVEEVTLKAKEMLKNKKLERIIILDDESYHEGVIGLAASKLVEEYFRPSIVISKGKVISKGSARSISGFNIIKAIRSAPDLLLGGGGHEMAAGFSLKSKDLPAFKKQLEKYALKNVSNELLQKKTKVDMKLDFSNLSGDLVSLFKKMEPFGIGNPTPAFITKNCSILDVKRVGKNGNHLKFKLKKEDVVFDAISFSDLNQASDFLPDRKADVLYNLEENYWNGYVSLQLKLKDLKYSI